MSDETKKNNNGNTEQLEAIMSLFPNMNAEFDQDAWAKNWETLMTQSQQVYEQTLAQQTEALNSGAAPSKEMADPFNLGNAFLNWTQNMMNNPEALMKTQTEYWNNMLSLWQQTAEKMMPKEEGADDTASAADLISPAKGDRRFSDPSWDENAIFNFLKQSYLLTADWMHKTASETEGLDEKEAAKVDFFTRQITDALSPTNFWATNPTVLKETVETNGENLVKGFDNMLTDMERGKGKLKITMTDPDAFEVGENLAVTEGKVVFENELMQLIQYSPLTEDVYKKPLMIVPPWINKFYILDLGKKSFIRWALEQGHTIFVISWVNPGSELREKSFENYMLDGPLAALDAIEQATGEKSVNAIGYCIGGTLLTSTLAYMAAHEDKRIASATFFTTLTDFEKAGELKIFIDEEQISMLEGMMEEKGYLDGSEMSMTFNMLRPNDLIWSFVINNYLMGKQPFPFDLLYWNSDNTRMPEKMHSFYLRQMYLENNLVKPGKVVLNGTPIDMGKIKTPCFFLSTKEDHIAPWDATYSAVNNFGGPVKFVLAGSGHIAGVINPPGEKEKYGYWINDKNEKNSDDWFAKAEQHPGSWWPEWKKWVGKKAGKKIPARIPGEGKLKAIEDAPGRYVKAR